MNASPRLAAVTLPSFETAAALSLLERKTARLGHVAIGAVGVLRPDRELLRFALAVEQRGRRIDFQRIDRRHGAGIGRRAAFQPAQQRGVQRIALLRRAAAGVRHLAGGLFDQQALAGDRKIDVAARAARA